jgi:hypothetical protein
VKEERSTINKKYKLKGLTDEKEEYVPQNIFKNMNPFP